MDLLQKVADDIISLKIQGATNVAIDGVNAFSSYINRLSTSMDVHEFEKNVNNAREILINTRPTEPALRNGLKKILFDMNTVKNDGTEAMEEKAIKSSEDYVKLIKDTKEKIIHTGSQRIQDGYTVMTHCHSSTTSEIFTRAFESGKDIKAICTETRPRYQGRKTAKELVDAGIPTTMVVDSSMRWILRKSSIDMIVIGMDAVTSQGTILNKIGSRLLSLAAKESDIPFYVAGSLLKFDSDTIFGMRTIIEMRDDTEITADWPEAPNGLKLFNPAFESVSRDLIDALITESGVFPPSIVYEIVRNTYPWMI
ncbi:MAG: S-methyl-5-thioribose-1-phosphate isomerase [Candidatus Heimdallarchaeota archaeon]|nr:S-methyl-5-thioribose-1-phosphate isomerase [Candidatus Heimdallarchaeota archaeon]